MSGFEREEDSKGNRGYRWCGRSDYQASLQTHAAQSKGLIPRIVPVRDSRRVFAIQLISARLIVPPTHFVYEFSLLD